MASSDASHPDKQAQRSREIAMMFKKSNCRVTRRCMLCLAGLGALGAWRLVMGNNFLFFFFLFVYFVLSFFFAVLVFFFLFAHELPRHFAAGRQRTQRHRLDPSDSLEGRFARSRGSRSSRQCLIVTARRNRKGEMDYQPLHQQVSGQGPGGHWNLGLKDPAEESRPKRTRASRRRRIGRGGRGYGSCATRELDGETPGDPGHGLAAAEQCGIRNTRSRPNGPVDIRPTSEFPVDPPTRAGSTTPEPSLACRRARLLRSTWPRRELVADQEF